MKFSIIIPVYQLEQQIGRLLTCFRNQTYSNFELFVIDDGSTDNLKEVVTPYLQDTRFRFYEKKNGGVASARNFGLNYVTGDYVIFIDGDDYVELDFLERIQTACMDNPNIDIIKYQMDLVDESGKQIRKVFDTAFSKLPTLEAFRILIQGEYVEPVVLYAYRAAFLKEHDFRFQEGKSRSEFGFTPLTLVYAKSIMSLPYWGYHFVSRDNKKVPDEKETRLRKMYDTLFQFDYMRKKVLEDEGISEELKRVFFDYIAYAVIMKGIYLPDEAIPEYVLELDKRGVVEMLYANSFGKMKTKFMIKRDMEAFIKKNKPKKK
ncbi:MAG: glycosyltransferase family 2 protein [Firmicutes bacterium]|nr:glycosyltransferase family 2 protein [Bacillota bacterium]